MRIENDALRTMITGAVDFVAEDGALFPRRFTSAQMEVANTSERFGIRAQASAGMTIHMRTDARELMLSYRLVPGSSKDVYSFDLWVNGQMYRHFPGLYSREPEGELRAVLPEGENELELYLPCLLGTGIRSLELAGATFAEPVRREKLLLCLGDSITQGYIADFSSYTYTAILARSMGADTVNQAIGGERFHPDMLTDMEGVRPSHILIAYGTNDWSTKNKEDFTRDARDYIDRVCALWPDVPTAMITPVWRADTETNGDRPEPGFTFAEARGILTVLAAGHPSVTVIPGESILPPVPELMADGYLHPNDLGFSVYAENLTRLLPAGWIL